MRLIDADEACKVLTEYYHHRTEIQHDVLREALDSVSTIDPVRHGRWVEFVNEDGYLDLRCSLCGEAQYVTFVRFNYCSNCGAKMKESE